jgi:hypothetical protein
VSRLSGAWLRGALALSGVAVAVWAFALFSPLGAEAQAPAPLFRAARSASASPHAIGLVRSRPVTVDLPQLGAGGRSAQSTLTLNLFDDVTLVATLQRTEPTASGGTAWIGQVVGDPFSLVSFVSTGGTVNGLIQTGGSQYQVSGTTVTEIDQGAYPRDRHATVPRTAARSVDSLPRSGMADDGSTIDVLVVYTADAAAGAVADGTTMPATVDNAIALTNQAYLNSGITQRLRLVGTAQVQYVEDAVDPLGAALSAITSGQIPNVSSLREQYAADEVVLVTQANGGYCGIAWMMQAQDIVGGSAVGFADHAFAAVARDCAVGNYSFAHELGHTMGADHDWYVSGRVNPLDQGVFPYSYGYVYLGANAAGSWRTVMSYDNECRARFAQSCSRVAYFSNPTVARSGVPTGLGGAADNATTLNATAPWVANFRQSAVPAAVPTATPTPTPAPVPTVLWRLLLPVGVRNQRGW